jgi:hypothetical protein
MKTNRLLLMSGVTSSGGMGSSRSEQVSRYSDLGTARLFANVL